jgi:hypothetical protein
VTAEARYQHWAAVAVVTWVIDVLSSRRNVDPAPDVSLGIALHNILAAAVEPAVDTCAVKMLRKSVANLERKMRDGI